MEEKLMRGGVNNVVCLSVILSVFLSSVASGTPPPPIGDFGFDSIKPLDFTAWSDGEANLTLVNDYYSDVRLDDIEIINKPFIICKVKTELPILLKPNETVQIEILNCTNPEDVREDYRIDVNITCTNPYSDMKHRTSGEICGIYGKSLKELQEKKQEEERKKQEEVILKIIFSIILTCIVLIDMFHARKYFTSTSPLLFILIYLSFLSLISSITVVNLRYTGELLYISVISSLVLPLLLLIVILLNFFSLNHKQKRMIIPRLGYMVVMYLINLSIMHFYV